MWWLPVSHLCLVLESLSPDTATSLSAQLTLLAEEAHVAGGVDGWVGAGSRGWELGRGGKGDYM